MKKPAILFTVLYFRIDAVTEVYFVCLKLMLGIIISDNNLYCNFVNYDQFPARQFWRHQRQIPRSAVDMLET